MVFMTKYRRDVSSKLRNSRSRQQHRALFSPDLAAFDPRRQDRAMARRVVASAALGAIVVLASSGLVLLSAYLAEWPEVLFLGTVLGYIPYIVAGVWLVVRARFPENRPLRSFALGMICAALALYGALLMLLNTDIHAPFPPD